MGGGEEGGWEGGREGGREGGKEGEKEGTSLLNRLKSSVVNVATLSSKCCL